MVLLCVFQDRKDLIHSKLMESKAFGSLNLLLQTETFAVSLVPGHCLLKKNKGEWKKEDPASSQLYSVIELDTVERHILIYYIFKKILWGYDPDEVLLYTYSFHHRKSDCRIGKDVLLCMSAVG